MFRSHIADWSYKHWTSRLRVEAGHPRFLERERDFSDFTYPDRFGHMKEALRNAGVDVNAEWSKKTTFHLEVKATLGPCEEAFFVSQNQLDKVCDTGTNAFLISGSWHKAIARVVLPKPDAPHNAIVPAVV